MKTEKEIDIFLDSVWDFFDNLTEEDASFVASMLLDIALDCGANNHLEAQGLLTCKLLDRHAELNVEIAKKLKDKRKKKKDVVLTTSK